MLEYRNHFNSGRTKDFFGWFKRPGVVDVFKSAEQARAIEKRLQLDRTIAGLHLYVANGISELPTDNTSETLPYILLATHLGSKLLRNHRMFLLAESHPDKIPGAKRHHSGLNNTWEFPYRGQTFFIKQYRAPDIAAFEFIGMELLAQKGAHIVPILWATRNKMLSVGIDGVQPNEKKLNKKIDIYRSTLVDLRRQLTREKLWEKMDGWGFGFDIDVSADHLRIRNLHSKNPLDWFTLIDGVCFQ